VDYVTCTCYSHNSRQAIALFNANQHDEAILRVQELANTRPNPNSLACGIVEVSAPATVDSRPTMR
jgi:hypothetical protein